MMGAVVTAHNAHLAMAIPMMGYVLAWVFPLYVNIYQRERMDQHRATTVGVEPSAHQKEVGLEKMASAEQVEVTEAK